MKYKILITALLLAGMLAGCQKTTEPETEQPQTSQEQEDIQEDLPSEEPAPETEASAEDFSFADVADLEFYFSSGAGGWYTVLYIHEDGSFDGHYQDADMDSSRDGYPNVTLYYSDFSGSFTEPEKVDDTTYVFQIDSIDYPLGMGQEIKDEILYDYSVAHGLDGGEDFYLYLPGAEASKLPENYLNWVRYYYEQEVTGTGLPFYGLYNEKMECGFSSYNPVLKSKEQIDWLLEQTELAAADLEEQLKQAETQADLNVLSGQLYEAWDSALNTIWGILKERLDEATMEQLTIEQRAWISEKEAAIEEAGAEYEGGSLTSLVCNQKAAELTKKRAYELAELI